jgi:hypothetical protein
VRFYLFIYFLFFELKAIIRMLPLSGKMTCAAL